jgi:hypothetical protein
MPKALVKIAYKQIIDAGSQTAFEQQVFNDSYGEFLIQQQSFAKGLPVFRWSDIKAKFPKSNPALPFKVSFAIAGSIDGLNKKIPGLQDTLNIKPISFVKHYFEIIESDVRDKSLHKIGIIYLTDTLTLFQTIGDYILLAPGDTTKETSDDPLQTFFLKMQENLSIFNYCEIKQ